MKFRIALMILLSLSVGLFAQQTAFIEISPDEGELMVGDSILFSVSYFDTSGLEHDTTAIWSSDQEDVGNLTEEGWFFALAPGECSVTASLDTLTAEVIVTVEDVDDDEPGNDPGHQLIVLPADTVFTLGDEIQFTAHAFSDSGMGQEIDSALVWTMAGMPVGSLSEFGFLTTSSIGFALIQATAGSLSGTAYIIIADSSADSTGINAVTITRDSPNPQGYSVMAELSEGEIWTMGGLPHPMNILNGGNVYFPLGSLSEDIRIHMALPGFFQINGDTVEYGYDGIVAGVQFRVMTDDSTIVEPYYFDTPLMAGIVFKRGLLNNLGIDPNTLGLHFAIVDDDTVYFDDEGIGYTTVDEYSNRIYSTVAHFSDLVVSGDIGTIVNIKDNFISTPSDFTLYENYPNPFNPTTTIRYEIPDQRLVTLTVYDVSGKTVQLLEKSFQPAGQYSVQWNGLNESGLMMSTGVYFARLQAGDQSEVIKLLFLK